MVYDGYMRAHTALCLLGHLSKDMSRVRMGYREDFMTGVSSSADLDDVRYVGLKQE